MLLKKRPQALLFDLDGTLADTILQLAKAAKSTACALGLKEPSLDETRGYVGNGVQMLLKRAIAGHFEVKDGEVSDELLTKARALFNDFYTKGLHDNYTVYPHVEETLRWCKDNGIKIAVVTNKPAMFSEPLLKIMGLYDLFDMVLGGEILDKKKPDPTPLLFVLDKLGINKEQACMVGDSANDIIPANSVNIPAVFFTFGYCRGNIEDMSQPDYKFDKWMQFLNMLKELPV